MANADCATCPRCGAPLSVEEPAGLCARCLLADGQGDKTVIPPAAGSSIGRAARKLTLAMAGIAAVLSVGLWFAGKGEWQPAEAEALLNRGVELHSQGKLDEAIAIYREVARLKPERAEPHYNLGVGLEAQGKLDEAVAEFRKAIRLEPGAVDAHVYLGNALKVQGRLDEAIASYRAAIRFDPNFAGAHFNLGLALRSKRKPEEALAELRKARDCAESGSDLAEAIEHELAGTDG